jgi:hypothetical protein
MTKKGSRITERKLDDGYRAVAFEVGDSLEKANARIRELESRPCPHVVTGSEGTSYCALAEESVKRLEGRLAKAQNAMRAAEELQLVTAAELDEAIARAEAAEDKMRRADFQIEQFRKDWQARVDYVFELEWKIEKLRTALEEVEWEPGGNGWLQCPWCGGYGDGRARERGHKPDCARQSALAPMPAEPNRPPHTHYCQHCAGRWDCQDGKCQGGDLKGCVPEVDVVAPAPAEPTPVWTMERDGWRAGEDAKRAVDEYGRVK